LGGHGALLYLSRHPEDIDYVVVMAPFMADPITINAIEDEGGLAQMAECPGIVWDYACNMLALIKNYIASLGNERRLALGYGMDDDFAEQNQPLADILPQDLVFTIPVVSITRIPGNSFWLKSWIYCGKEE
jgi:hypothetical protein